MYTMTNLDIIQTTDCCYNKAQYYRDLNPKDIPNKHSPQNMVLEESPVLH